MPCISPCTVAREQDTLFGASRGQTSIHATVSRQCVHLTRRLPHVRLSPKLIVATTRKSLFSLTTESAYCILSLVSPTTFHSHSQNKPDLFLTMRQSHLTERIWE
jgi:hypothetical protein